MEDGYYWAKRGGVNSDFTWEIVFVWSYEDGGQEVSEIENEYTFKLEDFEFGDKIEIPEKYGKINKD